MTNLVKSAFVIQCCVTDTPTEIGCNRVNYFAYDASSGGYPWFPDYWQKAEFFKTFEDAMDEFNRIAVEKPSCYGGSQGEAYRQLGIPHTLGHIAGGRTNMDGKFRFVLYVLEVRGNTLLTSSVIRREQMIIDVEQFTSKPNTPPIVNVHRKTYEEDVA